MSKKEEVSKVLIENLEKGLLNKDFSIDENFPKEIPQIIAEAFIVFALANFEGVEEFNVVPTKHDNVILVEIVDTNRNIVLLNVLLTIELSKNSLKVKNIILDVKNLKE